MPSAPEPDSFPGQLLRFAEELREEGLAVGTSELLDAFSALEEVPWTERADMREALAATLAKSQEDRRVFDVLFERFFFRQAEAEAVRHDVREEGGIDPSGAQLVDVDALRAQIAAAIREGNEGAMRDLARMAIAAFGRQGEGSGVIGVDVQRIRRALELRAEAQPDLPPEDPRSEGLPREGIRDFEAHLRRELERATIERTRKLP
ncbi:MAG: CoxE, partial [Actinomycetota bacterium]|nr:CoxE [Actinomycetota bacterium]